MSRKNYNPFKMWGSYLGFVSLVGARVFCSKASWSLDVQCTGPWSFKLGMIGFLIGWGIHALIRSYR